LEEVIKIFREIQNTSSLNEKQNIILTHKDNELFKKCLVFLLDSLIVTGISDKKIKKNINADVVIKFDPTFESCIEYLKNNNAGTDVDIAIIQKLISLQPQEHREFWEQMITKKLKLGADAKLVNKVIPNLIPTFDVMLGTSIEKCKLKDNTWISISRKLNGCFDGNTPITMADGTKKKIKDIQIGDSVMSFDEDTKELSANKVVNVFNNGLKPKNEWIKLETAIERSTHKKQITVTKNHKLFTPNGWKEANDLQVGDTIYIRDYELSETQKSVLLGIGLGDASVIFDNENVKTVRFSYPKKIDKYNNFLHKTCDLFEIYRGTYSKRKSGYGTKMEKCSIKTIYNIPSYFTNKLNTIRESYTFTDEILKQITPLALALYYIDDGSKLPCKDDGNEYAVNVHPRITLATHRHNKEDVERFSKFLLERYLITNRVARYKACYEKSGYQIELDMEGTYKFFDLIAKYIPYDLRDEKLSKHWMEVEYEDWTKDFGEYKLIEYKIENKIDSENIAFNYNKEILSNLAYDLEVENNHTYFASDFAVHNCRAAFIGDRIMTRQGKEYIGLDHIINDLQAMGLSDMFIDGELVYKNEEGLSDSEAFQKGTGIAMSKDSDKSSLKLVIFDMLPLDEFWSGKSKEIFSQRKIHLSKLEEAIKWNQVKDIEIVERFYEGTDHSEIQKWLDYAEEKDYEGVMVNLDTPYECKRTKNLIKVKKFKTCDIRCVGVEEGEGRNKGTLGALVCSYKGNRVNVGSGFSDEDRRYYWNNPDKIVGHIVTVKYKEETKNKNGGISIQFPTFEGVRFDKDEESYN
jgi:DNA ligase-1